MSESSLPRFDSPRICFAVLSCATAALAFALNDDDWVPLLDSANLAFHEAGHLIFGIFGETLGLYGGTLGQLVFPITAIVTFWRREQFLGVSLAWLWFFENCLNIARYMADARAQELPLVGGGEHDWWHIFTRWGVLNSDTSIAGLIQFAAWTGVLVLWAWTGLRWLQTRRN